MFMKILYSNDNFSQYVSDDGLWQDCSLFVGVEVKISFGKIFHDNVDIIFILERFMDIC